MKQLIPLEYINEACNVSSNIGEKEMKPNLFEAQDDLREILGAEFYDEIETQYPSTLSSDNNDLYENYIKDFLAWQSYFYSLGFSQSKSTPTGEREFNDANSSILADVKLVAKEKNIKRRSEKYKNAIVNYLLLEQSKDSTKFPKWSGYCRDTFSFGITAVAKNSSQSNIFSVRKAGLINQ